MPNKKGSPFGTTPFIPKLLPKVLISRVPGAPPTAKYWQTGVILKITGERLSIPSRPDAFDHGRVNIHFNATAILADLPLHAVSGI